MYSDPWWLYLVGPVVVISLVIALAVLANYTWLKIKRILPKSLLEALEDITK